jgi:hypothetical protein
MANGNGRGEGRGEEGRCNRKMNYEWRGRDECHAIGVMDRNGGGGREGIARGDGNCKCPGMGKRRRERTED